MIQAVGDTNKVIMDAADFQMWAARNIRVRDLELAVIAAFVLLDEQSVYTDEDRAIALDEWQHMSIAYIDELRALVAAGGL